MHSQFCYSWENVSLSTDIPFSGVNNSDPFVQYVYAIHHWKEVSMVLTLHSSQRLPCTLGLHSHCPVLVWQTSEKEPLLLQWQAAKARYMANENTVPWILNIDRVALIWNACNQRHLRHELYLKFWNICIDLCG